MHAYLKIVSTSVQGKHEFYFLKGISKHILGKCVIYFAELSFLYHLGFVQSLGEFYVDFFRLLKEIQKLHQRLIIIIIWPNCQETSVYSTQLRSYVFL